MDNPKPLDLESLSVMYPTAEVAAACKAYFEGDAVMGTKTTRPKKPYTTDGTPAISSVAGFKIL